MEPEIETCCVCKVETCDVITMYDMVHIRDYGTFEILYLLKEFTSINLNPETLRICHACAENLGIAYAVKKKVSDITYDALDDESTIVVYTEEDLINSDRTTKPETPEKRNHSDRKTDEQEELTITLPKTCYECKYCRKKFIDVDNFRRHFLRHSTPFQCEMCTKKFVDIDILKIHVTTCRIEFPVYCSICNEHFTILDEFERHFSYHGKQTMLGIITDTFNTLKDFDLNDVCDVEKEIIEPKPPIKAAEQKQKLKKATKLTESTFFNAPITLPPKAPDSHVFKNSRRTERLCAESFREIPRLYCMDCKMSFPNSLEFSEHMEQTHKELFCPLKTRKIKAINDENKVKKKRGRKRKADVALQEKEETNSDKLIKQFDVENTNVCEESIANINVEMLDDNCELVLETVELSVDASAEKTVDVGKSSESDKPTADENQESEKTIQSFKLLSEPTLDENISVECGTANSAEVKSSEINAEVPTQCDELVEKMETSKEELTVKSENLNDEISQVEVKVEVDDNVRRSKRMRKQKKLDDDWYTDMNTIKYSSNKLFKLITEKLTENEQPEDGKNVKIKLEAIDDNLEGDSYQHDPPKRQRRTKTLVKQSKKLTFKEKRSNKNEDDSSKETEEEPINDETKDQKEGGKVGSKHKTEKQLVGSKGYVKKPVFDCPKCLKKISGELLFAKHMSNHDTFLCSICNRVYGNKDTLKKHITYVHGAVKKHLCNLCGTSFVRESDLKIHLLRHSGIKRFFCKYCNKGFIGRWELNTHEKYHTGARPHLCNICGRGFPRLFSLTQHLRIHTGEKPFKCEHCDRRFTQHYDFKIHLRRHTGERFTCEFCDAEFLVLSKLREHMRSLHGVEIARHNRRFLPEERIHKVEEPSEENTVTIQTVTLNDKIDFLSAKEQEELSSMLMRKKQPKLFLNAEDILINDTDIIIQEEEL